MFRSSRSIFQKPVTPDFKLGETLKKMGFRNANALSSSRCHSKALLQAWTNFGKVYRRTYELNNLSFSPISFARFTESLPKADCKNLVLRDIKFESGSLDVHIPNLLQGASLNPHISGVSLKECGLDDDHARLIAGHLDKIDIDFLDLTGNKIGIEGRKKLAKAMIRENTAVKVVHCDELNKEDEKAIKAYIDKEIRSL
jgi:hypothetical protein